MTSPNDHDDSILWIETSQSSEPKKKKMNMHDGAEKTIEEQAAELPHRFMPKKKKKKRLSSGVQMRAGEIRKRKCELFLKMLFTARTTLTPWRDVEDVQEVHREIYQSIKFEAKEFNESEYGKRVTVVGSTPEEIRQSIVNLTFARDKLTNWKIRCRNISRSQIIMAHLTSLESILNVLVMEFNSHLSGDNDDTRNTSMLYSLYSISVINFCNALTSYPSEYKIDISVRNLAVLFECPGWIVSCRHSLSHPTANPPTVSILGEAIAFALEWMDRFFWSKAMCGQFNELNIISNSKPSSSKSKTRGSAKPQAVSSQTESQRPISKSNSTLNFGPPKPLASKEQIHHETCLLLFTGCTDNRATLKQNLKEYMLLSPNEFIHLFAEILTFGVPIHEKLSLNSYELPPLLLRRSGRIFGLIFSSLPADQMLILLLNMLLDLLFNTETVCEQQPDDPNLEYHQRARHSGRCWLLAILDALTVGITETNDQPKRTTIFHKSFDFFGDLVALKRRNTYVWMRMLYRICHMKLHQGSNQLVRQFYYLIDQDEMSPETHKFILEMIAIATATGEAKPSNPDAEVKTVIDLEAAINDDVEIIPSSTYASMWTIPIGASLNRGANLSGCENLASIDNQNKYILPEKDVEEENEQNVVPTKKAKKRSNTNQSIEIITIDD